MQTISTDVLVVGAGPSGLTAATLLAREEISTVAISRHSSTAPDPRATLTNQRTIEVFRDLDIEDEVRRSTTPLGEQGNRVYATSLVGPELFRFHSYGTGDRLADYWRASPCEPYNAPQYLLEPILLGSATRHGADVRFGHELLSIGQSEGDVVAVVLDRETGIEYEIRAKYAIGADGGRSRVAEQLEVDFEGESELIHMLSSWLEVDLTEYAAYRPSLIYSIYQPTSESWVGAGSLACMTPWNDWMMYQQYDAGQGEPDVSDAVVIAAARSLIGDPDIPIRVKGTSKWQVNHLVAKRYRHGRIFLAGDAAHRHPPAGGRGANTSIQDSFNLAWKLALVLKRQAGDSLLDSYDHERRPVGQHMVERTMEDLRNMLLIGEALGLQRGQSPDDGREALRHLASDEPGAAERRRRLAEVMKLQEERQSNGHGTDLGQRYRSSSAVVDDGTPWPESTRDPEVYYHPTTHPGAHLPHAWLELDRRKLSTLDLVGRGRFSLIVGVGGEPWAKAAETLSRELGIELPVHFVGYRCEFHDAVGAWAQLREIDDNGALLVRPDRHIAWRSLSSSDSPESALRDALQGALCLETTATNQ